MIIQLTTGRETFRAPDGTMEIYAFYKRAANSREVPVHVASKDRQSGLASINQPEWIQASSTNRNNGTWIIGNYALPENSYLKLMIKRKRSGEWGYTVGQFMLRMAETAPLRRMRIPLTEHPSATQTAAYCEGRFQYVNPDDFEALGIETSYLKQFNVDFEDFFEDEIIERGRKAAPVPKVKEVATVSGKTVTIKEQAPKRLLIVRRR